jgi:leucyl-tRNA synthetase
MVNSGAFNGLGVEEGKAAVSRYLEENGLGAATVNYRLRDWVFSRQRYWGEPIPLIHCPCCGVVAVPDSELPVTLPHVDSYKPTDTGESPLALVHEWVNVACPNCKKPAKRETNTMPQWAGSSWYFLRYVDAGNDSELVSKDKVNKFLPVDYYVGGVEHAVLHLLYARFYTKFLYDIGVVNFEEPFTKLFNQGMITRFGFKMSKSKGNGVSPNEMLPKYGCDALRMYILFIGPPELDADWTDSGIEGVYRFLNKLWRLVVENVSNVVNAAAEHEKLRHKMIYDISRRMDNLSMNTVVAGFMEYTNKLGELARAKGIDRETLETLVVMLAPFAPHIAEELWEVLSSGHGLGYSGTVFKQPWPLYDLAKAADDTITMVIQINGKLRGDMQVDAKIDKEEAISIARELMAKRLENMQIIKEIFVPGKLVNFVVRGD